MTAKLRSQRADGFPVDLEVEILAVKSVASTIPETRFGGSARKAMVATSPAAASAKKGSSGSTDPGDGGHDERDGRAGFRPGSAYGSVSGPDAIHCNFRNGVGSFVDRSTRHFDL